jgi:hypothetical protein
MLLKAIKIKLNNLSIRQKLIYCVLFFIILPLLLAALFINIIASQIISSKSSEAALQVLKQTKVNIDNFVCDTEAVSMLFADPKVQSLAKLYISKTYPDIDIIKRSLMFT